jgi:hypothetical protein
MNPMSFWVKQLWINNWCLNLESIAWAVSLRELVGPVTGGDVDRAQSLGYKLKIKVQLRKIAENLSGTEKSSRQSSIAACVRAASTRQLITSRNKCLEICLTEVPHTSRFLVKIPGSCTDLVGKKKWNDEPVAMRRLLIVPPADYWRRCGQQTSIPGMHSQPQNERVACTVEYCCWWTGHFSYWVNSPACSVPGRPSFTQYPLTWTLGGLQSRSCRFGE